MSQAQIYMAKQWATNTYFDQNDRDEITQLIESGNEAEIKERFYQNLEFGTGGLRSIIGMGPNRMNKYNVRKATQALASTALSANPENKVAAVSYDCRRFSDEFAKEVCSVFAANGIKAFMFPELTPTPMLSYAVRHYGACCGVMVTASHNPKDYNGYKAYWSDGSQVTPPYDQKVIDAYNAIESWDQVKSLDFEAAKANGLIEMIPSEVNQKFFDLCYKNSVNPQMCKDKGSEIWFPSSNMP